MTDYERGWVAGIIDGEGYLGLIKRANRACKQGFYFVPVLVVGMTDYRTIRQIHTLVKAGSVWRRKSLNPSKWNDVWRFSLSANGLRGLLPDLQLITKERQRVLVLEALSLLHTGHHFHNDKEQKAQNHLVAIYNELRRLNKRGRL